MKDDLCYDAAETEKYMGVRPDQVADLLALKGDSVDNIPGAPGIGDKGARDLITTVRFGGERHRARGRGRAQDLSRKPAKQSRPDHAEQAARDHPRRRAGGTWSSTRWRCAKWMPTRCASCIAPSNFRACCAIWRRPRRLPSSAIISSSARKPNWTRGSKTLPADAPLAVAVGEVMEQPVMGFSAKPGVARSLTLDKIPIACVHRPRS